MGASIHVTRHVRWMAGLGVVSAVLAGAVGVSAEGRLTARCAALPSAQDLRYAREYRQLLSAKAAQAWPGWKGMPPLLQRSGGCEFLIGHPSPPKTYRRTTATVGSWRVYAAAAGTVTPGAVATTWKVGAVWVTMVPTRAEFQGAVDRQVGRGAVRLTDTSYVRALVHEAFHAHQMTASRGALPSFGSTLEQDDAAALLAPLGDAEQRLAGEGKALAAALDATSLAAARTQAAVFATRRAGRREATKDPRGLAAFEQQVEWAEGAARYADLRLVLLAGARGYVPTQGIRYSAPAASRRAFLAGLADPAPRADGLRGRWEDLGAGEALLLDRLAAGWQDAVLAGRTPLESALAQAVQVPEALADLRVARIAVGHTAFRVALAENAGQWSRGLSGVSELRPLDGLLFRFGEDVSAGFTTHGAAMPLQVAFFARDGRLIDVQTMPRCSADPCPVYRSPQPFRDALEAPAGTLDSLRRGSHLVVSGR